MTRKAIVSSLVVLTMALWSGCSSGSRDAQSGKAAIPLEKIVGKAQTLIESSGGATDNALNAGGPSVYLWIGLQRYRLFLKTPAEIVHGTYYVADGLHAQKLIDEIGDPDQGKNGYPLEASCARAVKRAWPNLSFDATDSTVALVRARVKRYPARPLFLVTQIRAATADEISAAFPDAKATAADAKVAEIDVPADKQRALLVEGPTVLPAPLWEPNGGTETCKLIIGVDGKIAELETGRQLCEAVPWSKFRYQPTLKNGRPVRVRTDVEVRFEKKAPGGV